MATPMNPLDLFSTYTYHFELHAAKDWSTLKNVENSDFNASTDERFANGTLLINTRKDAHQTIDDVKFKYFCSSQNQFGEFTPDVNLSMQITEPNGAFFIEKIHNLMIQYNMKDISSLVFGLKIFFVGRTPEDAITTIEMPSIIPMMIHEMSSKFTYKGGEYGLSFVGLSMTSRGNEPRETAATVSALAGYCNKTVSLKAKTVVEALKELESKLNQNYEDTYEKELKNPGARTLKYFINISGGITGKLSLINRDSYDPEDFVKMTFDPNKTILSWIYDICRSSKELNELVGGSKNGIPKEDHPGVKMISVIPRYYPKGGSIELHYDVGLYTGGGEDLYTFDFMFAEPGKNVDVIDFDIQMTSLRAWFADGSRHGVDQHSSLSGQMPIQDPKKCRDDILVSDVSKEQATNPIEPKVPPISSGDAAFLPSLSRNDGSGHVKFDNDSVPSAKLAFTCISEMHGAYNHQVAFTIRGHMDLLRRGILQPDRNYFSGGNPSQTPISLTSPTQVKVNIRSPNPGHPPFYYTGKYGLMSIENTFSGGKFLQILYVQMQEPNK